MELENGLIVLSFLILIISIRGDFWKHERKGVKKISLPGWLIILAGFMTCGIGVYKNYQNQAVLDRQTAQKDAIKKTGGKKLFRTLNQLMYPFSLVHKYGSEHFGKTHDTDYTIAILYNSPDFMRYVDSFHILNLKFIPPDIWVDFDTIKNWGDLFAEYPIKVKKKLEEIFTMYGPHLDAEVVDLIGKLLEDYFFQQRLLRFQELASFGIDIKENKSDEGPSIGDVLFREITKLSEITPSIEESHKTSFANFLQLVNKLHDLAGKDLDEGEE